MGMREVQALLAYFHLFDIDCLLRPPTLEKTGLYRYLEEGASGLMIPFVCTADKARDVPVQTVSGTTTQTPSPRGDRVGTRV